MSKWEKNLYLFDQLVALNPNFERKGKTMPYTSANGHMFSLLNKDGEFGIRLSKASSQKFIEKYNTGEYKSYGAIMREYVLVPDSLLSEPKILGKYLQESFEFVMSKPPK